MKAYVFLVASNPTRLRLYLAEKAAAGAKLPVDEVMVNLAEGEQKHPEHLARNPLGKLPVLELDDGSFLTESAAIVEYLEERFPEPPMIGRDPEQRARVRELDRVADLGVLLPVGSVVHATRSPLGAPPNPAVAEHFRQRLPPNLGVLESALADGRPFLAGPQPSIADCTLAAALQFARFREIDLGLENGYPGLARWDRAYRERPPAKAVLVS